MRQSSQSKDFLRCRSCILILEQRRVVAAIAHNIKGVTHPSPNIPQLFFVEQFFTEQLRNVSGSITLTFDLCALAAVLNFLAVVQSVICGSSSFCVSAPCSHDPKRDMWYSWLWHPVYRQSEFCILHRSTDLCTNS